VVPSILDVSTTARAVVVLIGVSGGTVRAHGGRPSFMLELALAATSKLLGAGLAALDDIIELRNQLMVFIDCLEIAQEVLGGVTEESDTVGAFVMAVGGADLVVVIFGFLVDPDEIIEMRWLDILRIAGRGAVLGAGELLVLNIGSLHGWKLVDGTWGNQNL
jgi:hypothetical protein